MVRTACGKFRQVSGIRSSRTSGMIGGTLAPTLSMPGLSISEPDIHGVRGPAGGRPVQRDGDCILRAMAVFPVRPATVQEEERRK